MEPHNDMVCNWAKLPSIVHHDTTMQPRQSFGAEVQSLTEQAWCYLLSHLFESLEYLLIYLMTCKNPDSTHFCIVFHHWCRCIGCKLVSFEMNPGVKQGASFWLIDCRHRDDEFWLLLPWHCCLGENNFFACYFCCLSALSMMVAL